MNSTTTKAWRSYTYFVICAILIFLTIPFARVIQKFIQHQFGRSFFGYLVLAAVLAGFSWVVVYVIRQQPKEKSTGNYLWLAAVAGTYVFFTIKLWENPEEAIHFLEYGLLSYFAFRALSHHIRDVTIYITASLITLFMGTVDEIIQWVWPGRYWDMRDVGFNLLSGVLLQLGIYKGVDPRIISEKVQPKSIRILSVVFASCVVLLGLCASNTPSRMAHYTERFPILAFLHSNASMMSDFGYKHNDPDIGVFFSRFTEAELKSIDRLRNLVHAKILNETRGMDYGDFLETYNPYRFPYLYEMRIHIFRRDQYLEKGQKEQAQSKKHLAISFKENLILEKYFNETLKQTDYQWPQTKRENISKQAEPLGYYESPVGSDLFTSFREKELWSVIAGILLLLFLVNVWMKRRFETGSTD